jgi:hypothetical protein
VQDKAARSQDSKPQDVQEKRAGSNQKLEIFMTNRTESNGIQKNLLVTHLWRVFCFSILLCRLCMESSFFGPWNLEAKEYHNFCSLTFD